MKRDYKKAPREFSEFLKLTLIGMGCLIIFPFYIFFLLIRPFIAIIAFFYTLLFRNMRLTEKWYDKLNKPPQPTHNAPKPPEEGDCIGGEGEGL